MDIEILLKELIDILKTHKQKPYLPYWGNVFSILYKVSKMSNKNKQDIIFYHIQPAGVLKYDYRKKIFIAEIPDVTIKLPINKLADSLLQDRFLPINLGKE
ncbi:MAG: hypothetical protein AB7V16_00825 [Vulcanibacillus sp.]